MKNFRKWPKFEVDVPGVGLLAGAGLLAGSLAVSVGCQKASQPAGNAEVKPTYNKDTGQLERITYDRNHDGKPDAWLFMDGTRVLMAQLDENYDGIIDRWEYYGDRPAAGADAAPAAGMPALPRSILQRAEQATRGDGKVNRREWYEKGQLVRVEEDTTGERPRRQVGDLVRRRAAEARARHEGHGAS